VPLVLPSHRAPPPPAAQATTDVPLRVLTWTALGTRCSVQYSATSAAQAQAFETAAVGWVAAFEAKYSRFRPDSLLSRINAAAGLAPVAIDAEMEGLLALCDRLHFMTQGVLDPTALPLLRLWDYKAAHPRLPTEDELVAARRLVGWKKVQRTPGHVFLPERGMALDFGGFGKEWAVDIVAQIARDHGLPAALVDFGHDLRAFGVPPGRPAWHIGLEDPANPGATKGSLALTQGQGVASSGDYLRRPHRRPALRPAGGQRLPASDRHRAHLSPSWRARDRRLRSWRDARPRTHPSPARHARPDSHRKNPRPNPRLF
jgi:thiamine biosynthesis lipoprotein